MRAMPNIKVSNKFSDNVAKPKIFGNCSKKLERQVYSQRRPRPTQGCRANDDDDDDVYSQRH